MVALKRSGIQSYYVTTLNDIVYLEKNLPLIPITQTT